MQMPTMPQERDLNAVLRTLQELLSWLRNLHLAGLQVTMFTQAEVDAVTGLENVGKLYFTSDTNHLYCGINTAGSFALQEIF